jgi:hypothetical protein
MKFARLLALAAIILFAPKMEGVGVPLKTQPAQKSAPRLTQTQLEERIKKVEADLAEERLKVGAADQKATRAEEKAAAAAQKAAGAPQKETGWLADHALAVQAFAAIAGIGLTLALTVTTIAYAFLTNGILRESQKSRLAAEKQANAAQSQASVAQRTLGVLQQQIDDQAGLGYSVMQATMGNAMSAIEYWKGLDLPRFANMSCLPPTDGLVPADTAAALNHARRIHGDSARRLSSAFDELRTARNEIEVMRELGRQGTHGPGFYEAKCGLVVRCLESALDLLQKAQAGLLVQP